MFFCIRVGNRNQEENDHTARVEEGHFVMRFWSREARGCEKKLSIVRRSRASAHEISAMVPWTTWTISRAYHAAKELIHLDISCSSSSCLWLSTITVGTKVLGKRETSNDVT